MRGDTAGCDNVKDLLDTALRRHRSASSSTWLTSQRATVAHEGPSGPQGDPDSDSQHVKDVHQDTGRQVTPAPCDSEVSVMSRYLLSGGRRPRDCTSADGQSSGQARRLHVGTWLSCS